MKAKAVVEGFGSRSALSFSVEVHTVFYFIAQDFNAESGSTYHSVFYENR